jgi:hypothetical protein
LKDDKLLPVITRKLDPAIANDTNRGTRQLFGTLRPMTKTTPNPIPSQTLRVSVQ